MFTDASAIVQKKTQEHKIMWVVVGNFALKNTVLNVASRYPCIGV